MMPSTSAPVNTGSSAGFDRQHATHLGQPLALELVLQLTCQHAASDKATNRFLGEVWVNEGG